MDLLAALTAATPWADQAACLNAPEEFVANGQHQEADPRWALPRLNYCAWCPVRVECLTFALETNADGVFGGTVTTDRHSRLPGAESHRAHEWEEDWQREARRAEVPKVADELESGFPERLAGWRKRLEEMARECERCGETFHSWPKQRRIHCSQCAGEPCPKCQARARRKAQAKKADRS